MDNSKNFELNKDGGEQAIPEPPPLEIEIRTMSSDLKALKEGGGELVDSGTRAFFIRDKKESDSTQNVLKNIPGYLGPEKTIFPATEDKTDIAAAQGQNVSNIASSGNYWNLIIWAIIIIGFIVGLVSLGYYVVFPMIIR